LIAQQQPSTRRKSFVCNLCGAVGDYYRKKYPLSIRPEQAQNL
jgi:hypothetical protein